MLKWYVLKDAEGKLHVTAAESHLSFLEIPAGYWARELREEYDEDTDTTETKLKEVFHSVTLLFKQNDKGGWYLSSLIMENESGRTRTISVKEF